MKSIVIKICFLLSLIVAFAALVQGQDQRKQERGFEGDRLHSFVVSAKGAKCKSLGQRPR